MTRYAPGSPFAAPGLPAERTRQPATCSRCARPFLYIEMVGSAKLMPCDPAQRYGDGRRHLIERVQVGKKLLGKMIARAGEEVLGFEPHWGTCPNRPEAKVPATSPVATPAPRPSADPCPVYQLGQRPSPPAR